MYGAEALQLVHRGYVYDNSKVAHDASDTFNLLFRTIDGEQVKLYSPPVEWPQTYQYLLQDVAGAGAAYF